MRKIYIILLALLLIVPFTASCKENTDTGSTPSTPNTSKPASGGFTEEDLDKMSNIILIEMDNGGKIVIELYPDIAPITVNNFKKLVAEGFYDGLIFHRVIKNFMIQGGDPKGTGTGGPGYQIKGEFKLNGVENNLKHTRGVISMARSSGYDTAGSQFFIVHADSPHLDGQYASFGRVLEGMDVVDEIASVRVNADSKPNRDQKMKSVTFVDNYTPAEDNS